MQAFTKLDARAAPLPLANIDTDQIIPKQFLKTVEREGLSKGLFYDFRFDEAGKEKTDFVLNRPEYKGAGVLVTGDNTAYSVVVSRYMLALQHERGGLVLDNAEAGLRTACLTGVATTKLSKEVTTPDGNTVALTAGDIDEAVSGLLTNGLVAGDVNGESVPAGFSRIDAFRIGVLGDDARCIKRFP